MAGDVCTNVKEDERVRDAGPRQRDIVQIAESRDIDHHDATAAEPFGDGHKQPNCPSFCDLFF